jgi:hypothetical protein
MVPIAPIGSGRQAGHATRRSGSEDPLGCDRGDVVALVDDDVPVAGQQFLQALPARKALDGSDVQPAGWLAPAGTDDPDLLDVHVKELGQPLDPLLKQRLAVHQYERRASAGGNQVRCDHGLADPRRRAQHSELMGEHLPRGIGLGIGELAREPGVELDPVDALVDQLLVS